MDLLRSGARLLAGVALLTTASIALTACASSPNAAAEMVAGAKAGPWVNLLDGSTKAWRGYGVDSMPSAWAFDPATGVLTRTRFGGDIVTKAQYDDFELEVEWRIKRGGNSGIFYRANEGTKVIYENAPEMQILDNQVHNDGKNTLTSAGANYALDAPIRDVTRPVGEWNKAKIIAVGPHVEHWLNDVKLLEYEAWTPEWTAKVAKTKFNQWPTYGLARKGHIGLQEHGDEISFRNIRIRELKK
jgi:hypothetical protein